MLVHEAYSLENPLPRHSSAVEVLEACGIFPELETVFLVHINRNERRTKKELFHELGGAKPYAVIIPEPGFEFSLF